MENFAPGLRPAIIDLANTLRFVVFFVAIAGLMLHVQRARADFDSLARPLVCFSIWPTASTRATRSTRCKRRRSCGTVSRRRPTSSA